MEEQHCTELPESFYRIIHPSVLREHKLKMPDKFVEKYGGELSNSVRLTVPAGGIWHIGLEREGKVLWLHEGLHKFMQNYSIGFGYFVMFKYKGDSELDVHIFDLTATEIDYTFSSPPERPDHVNQGLISERNKFYVGNVETLEIFDSPVASPTRCSSKDNALKECPGQEVLSRLQKVSPTVGGNDCPFSEGRPMQITEAFTPSSGYDPIQNAGSIAKKLFHEHEEDARTSCGGTSNYLQRKQVTAKEKRMALAAAKRFKPGYPYFLTVLQEYNVKKGFLLNVPAAFSRENECINLGHSIKLEDSNGEKWPVRSIKVRGKVTCLSKGWSTFVKEKNLDAGDVCVFELIPIDNPTLKVTLFRAQQDA